MEFGVIHEIYDREAWQDCLDNHAQWPESFVLLAFAESKNRSRAICLWRAPSESILRQWLNENLGRGAANVIMPIDLHQFAETLPS